MPDPPPTTSASGSVSSLMCLPSVPPGPDRTRPAVTDSGLFPSGGPVAKVHHSAIAHA